MRSSGRVEPMGAPCLTGRHPVHSDPFLLGHPRVAAAEGSGSSTANVSWEMNSLSP